MQGGGLTEKDAKKLEKSWKYIKNNWQGIRNRIKIAQLRIYWKNGGDMLEIVRRKKEEKITKKEEEEKYIEALQTSMNSQISAKIFFNTLIAGLC